MVGPPGPPTKAMQFAGCVCIARCQLVSTEKAAFTITFAKLLKIRQMNALLFVLYCLPFTILRTKAELTYLTLFGPLKVFAMYLKNGPADLHETL